MPDPVVIGQNDQSEVHVQAMDQSGRRHLDIRIWRRGPSGFAPSRNALIVDRTDLDALQQGIVELLKASNRGRQVARVVRDHDDGRRLRAETEPFGTHYMARLGFWQRIRDTWRSADDGLVMPADQLESLQVVLRRFRPWTLEERDDVLDDHPPQAASESQNLWPSVGADWLTIEPERVAFHPRGIRITCARAERDSSRVIVRQWRREGSLWVPDEALFSLADSDLGSLLDALVRILDTESPVESGASEDVLCADGSTLRVMVRDDIAHAQLVIECHPAGDEAGTNVPCLSMPAEHIARFGRALTETRLMLTADHRISSSDQSGPASALGPTEVVGVDHEHPGADQPSANSVQGMEIAQDDPGPESIVAEELAPVVELPPDEPVPVRVPIGEVYLEGRRVELALEDGVPDRLLALLWDGESLLLPADDLDSMLAGFRTLYYDALRGHRGRILTVSEDPLVQVSVRTIGTEMRFTLQSAIDDGNVPLSFPGSDVPGFLDAVRAALAEA